MKIRRVVSQYAEVVAETPATRAHYGQAGNSPEAIAAMLRPIVGDSPVENFAVVLLNGKHRVIGIAIVSVGTPTVALVHPREVFGPAVRMGAVSVIVAHNHPSGDPEPSREDHDVTQRLKQAGELLGIQLLDHIVIGLDSHVSLRARGLV